MRPIKENVVLFQVQGKDGLDTLTLRKDLEQMLSSNNIVHKKIFKKERFIESTEMTSTLTFLVRETDFDLYFKNRLSTSDQYLVLDADRIAYKVTLPTGNKQKLGQFRVINNEQVRRTKCFYYDLETDTNFTTAISEL